ncbi:MAG: endonuclease/exonuclease/phosphatase family protein [bacterium]
MTVHLLSWNLFHGRDFPPDPKLFTPRSRLLRTTERNATHVQVNRELLDEFAAVLAGARWDIVLLQECPPRFAEPLGRRCEAEVHRALTARNALLPLTSALARHNPDLIASWEGGSNTTLVRRAGSTGPIADRRRLTLRPSARPERRTMGFTRLASGLCVANLHASTSDSRAEEEVLAAAARAVEWAGDAPLVLGGDLNVRPCQGEVFVELRERYGFSAPADPDAIDHLLARGLEVVEPARVWPPQARELSEQDLALRPSDHSPVQASFRL